MTFSMFQAALFAIDQLFETEYKPVPVFVSTTFVQNNKVNIYKSKKLKLNVFYTRSSSIIQIPMTVILSLAVKIKSTNSNMF